MQLKNSTAALRAKLSDVLPMTIGIQVHLVYNQSKTFHQELAFDLVPLALPAL